MKKTTTIPLSKSTTLTVPTAVEKSIAPPPSKKETIEALALRLFQTTNELFAKAVRDFDAREKALKSEVRALPFTPNPTTHLHIGTPTYKEGKDTSYVVNRVYRRSYYSDAKEIIPFAEWAMNEANLNCETTIPRPLQKKFYDLYMEVAAFNNEHGWFTSLGSERERLVACRKRVRDMMAGTVPGATRVADMLRNEDTVKQLDEFLARLAAVNKNVDKGAVLLTDSSPATVTVEV